MKINQLLKTKRMNKKILLLVIILLVNMKIGKTAEFPVQSNSNSNPEEIVPLKTVWKFNFGKENKAPVFVYGEGFLFWGDEDGKLTALDTKTGKIKWQFKADGAIYEKPTEYKGMVYFCAYNGNVHALDILTGKEKWKFNCGPELKFRPVVFENKVVIGYKKNLICLDLETGLDLWNKNCFSMNYLDFQIRDSIVYFTDNLDIVAVDAANCTNLWTYNQKVFGMSRIESAFDFIYYCNLDGVYAINSLTGKAKWKFSFDQKNPPKAYKNMLVCDSSLYVPVDNILYVFNVVSGKIQWGYKLKKEILNIAVYNDKTYFTESTNTIYCMNNKSTKRIEKIYSVETGPISQFQIYNGIGYYLTPEGFLCAVKIP